MTQRATTEEFIKKSIAIHGNRYNYNHVKYINNNTLVRIICYIHGAFYVKPVQHTSSKSNCPKCSIEKNKININDFIKRSMKKHSNNYNYSETKCNNATDKVKIICPIHGIFFQLPSNHFKYGCNKCGFERTGIKRKISQKDYILKAEKRHNNYYDYSKTVYKKSHKRVIVICPRHGDFTVIATEHISVTAKGCLRCKASVSIAATEWLDYIGIKPKFREYRLPENLRIPVDGYNPDTNTVYQFHGDFWHGNPKKHKSNEINPKTQETYGDAYKRTLLREQQIKDYGYNLVTMWDSDWKMIHRSLSSPHI